jgi:DNA mismatch repair protein MutL
MSSIKPLETGAVKFLSATQVITSPFSAVKELLENALDARATVLLIEISANTVDVVQVRDNGHGIAPDDRSMCCRRHTTSKLSSIADLKIIGGSSLGFRGEALFALAQVAGKSDITTRVEGESTAVKLEIDRNGEVTGCVLWRFLDA